MAGSDIDAIQIKTWTHKNSLMKRISRKRQKSRGNSRTCKPSKWENCVTSRAIWAVRRRRSTYWTAGRSLDTLSGMERTSMKIPSVWRSTTSTSWIRNSRTKWTNCSASITNDWLKPRRSSSFRLSKSIWTHRSRSAIRRNRHWTVWHCFHLIASPLRWISEWQRTDIKDGWVGNGVMAEW